MTSLHGVDTVLMRPNGVHLLTERQVTQPVLRPTQDPDSTANLCQFPSMANTKSFVSIGCILIGGGDEKMRDTGRPCRDVIQNALGEVDETGPDAGAQSSNTTKPRPGIDLNAASS